MLRRFENTSGTSRKFWEVRVVGAVMTVRFGRLGTAGQAKEKSFDTPEAAALAAERLVAEKLAGGYVVVSSSEGDDAATNGSHCDAVVAFQALRAALGCKPMALVPASDAELASLQVHTPLGEEHRAWLAALGGTPGPDFPGLCAAAMPDWAIDPVPCLSAREVERELLFLRKIFAEEGDVGEHHLLDGPVWSSSWVPFAQQGRVNVVVDLNPGVGGPIGQLVYLRTDGDRRVVLAPSITAWFRQLEARAQAGELVVLRERSDDDLGGTDLLVDMRRLTEPTGIELLEDRDLAQGPGLDRLVRDGDTLLARLGADGLLEMKPEGAPTVRLRALAGLIGRCDDADAAENCALLLLDEADEDPAIDEHFLDEDALVLHARSSRARRA